MLANPGGEPGMSREQGLMSKADKAGEPSMDEILASIRKIIAEEPAGSRKGSGSEPASHQVSGPGLPAQKPPQAETRAKPEPPTRSDVPMGSAREPAKSFFPEPARGPAAMADGLAPSATGQQSVDFTSIVPRRAADGSLEMPGERKLQSGRLPEWLARSAPTPQSARPNGPLPPPADPTRFPGRSPASGGAALSELAAPRGNGAAPIPPPPGVTDGAARGPITSAVVPPSTQVARPQMGAGTKSEPTPGTKPEAKDPSAAPKPAATAPAADAAASWSGSILPTQPQDSTGNAAGKVGQSANAPMARPVVASASPSGESPVIDAVTIGNHSTLPAETASARNDKPLPIAEPIASMPKPAALGDRAKPVKPNVAADLVPTVAAAGVRSLEDTVVDLLRPMLRQWLDENMPRMVEKALRIELAQSVKPKVEPPKH